MLRICVVLLALVLARDLIAFQDDPITLARDSITDLMDMQDKIQNNHAFLNRMYLTRSGVDEVTGRPIDESVEFVLRLQASRVQQIDDKTDRGLLVAEISNNYDKPKPESVGAVELIKNGQFFSSTLSIPSRKKTTLAELKKVDLPEAKWHRIARDMNPFVQTLLALEHRTLGMANVNFVEQLRDMPMTAIANAENSFTVEISQKSAQLNFVLRVQFDRRFDNRPILAEWFAIEADGKRKLLTRTETRWKKRDDEFYPANIFFYDVSRFEDCKFDVQFEWLNPSDLSSKLFEPGIAKLLVGKSSQAEAMAALLERELE